MEIGRIIPKLEQDKCVFMFSVFSSRFRWIATRFNLGGCKECERRAAIAYQ